LARRSAGRPRDTDVFTAFESQNASWLATSAARVRRMFLLTIPVIATTTSEPTKLPICMGAQTARHRKSGRSLTVSNKRASHRGT
jgi:hypothetical protein